MEFITLWHAMATSIDGFKRDWMEDKSIKAIGLQDSVFKNPNPKSLGGAVD